MLTVEPLPAETLRETMDAARARLLRAQDGLSDEQLEVPELPTINPMRWELGHVAFFWDVFVRRAAGADRFLLDGAERLYDSFDVAHDERWGLTLPDRAATLDYLARVTEDLRARLAEEPTAEATYLHQLAACHEDMHAEALVYARQTLAYPAPEGLTRPCFAAGEDLYFEPTELELGAAPGRFSFDNERPRHRRRVEAFAIAAAPVTQGAFAAFVDDGGYGEERLWSRQGWVWRCRQERDHPRDWRRDDGWLERRFDAWLPLEASAPIAQVSWHEAEAYCRWAKRRLPREAEWERAAKSGRGQGWLGGLWQWCADAFYPFDGYVVDEPYREYSAPWFGYPKVLKGGSWASAPSMARIGFRNFFRPDRDDVFAGFRTCAV